ncbi:hypothetical protein TESG_01722 [Trichophyton tonsurans CBS 112818]|uniref:Uncharacterized protein n=2 Tax=Trichophyton TaxID=5550 RepID=F2PT21_TRIEC|nr:hypothetical protein TESG_01722 [Trichophyton tonsurans CBS 112818]EGE05039.1 hypothetical protein TEQG_04057 [Trichophyton equinum CBS 127.97]
MIDHQLQTRATRYGNKGIKERQALSQAYQGSKLSFMDAYRSIQKISSMAFQRGDISRGYIIIDQKHASNLDTQLGDVFTDWAADLLREQGPLDPAVWTIGKPPDHLQQPPIVAAGASMAAIRRRVCWCQPAANQTDRTTAAIKSISGDFTVYGGPAPSPKA